MNEALSRFFSSNYLNQMIISRSVDLLNNAMLPFLGTRCEWLDFLGFGLYKTTGNSPIIKGDMFWWGGDVQMNFSSALNAWEDQPRHQINARI